MVNSVKCSGEIKKTETYFVLRAYGVDEIIVGIQKSRFSAVVLTLSRLVKI